MFNPLHHQVILRNEWHEIIYFGAVSMIRHNYFESSEKMNDDSYKLLMEEHGQILREKKPMYILEDTRNFLFVINPELQKWAYSYMLEMMKDMEVEKTAIITGTDFLTQLSIEQMIPEERIIIKDLQYFEDEEAALLWLTGPL